MQIFKAMRMQNHIAPKTSSLHDLLAPGHFHDYNTALEMLMHTYQDPFEY